MVAREIDLARLFNAHGEGLRAYLQRKVHDLHVAADLAQEAFLRLAERLPQAGVDNSVAYLYRTARNLAIDHFRQQERRQTFSYAPGELPDLAEDRSSTEDTAAARQRLKMLREVIDELSSRTREIFVLNRIEGLSYLAIARQLQISESSVQKHLAAALAHVIRRLKSA